MSQTRYLRAVFALNLFQRLRLLWFGRVAVSASIEAKAIRDVTGGVFTGDDDDAEYWIRTGSILERVDEHASESREVVH